MTGRHQGSRPTPRPAFPGLVFTRAAALAAGWTSGQLDTELRRGRLVADRRGVYRPAEPRDTSKPTSTEQRFAWARERVRAEARAAYAASDREVVVSHESAAAFHELWLVWPYRGAPVLSRVRAAGEPGRPASTRVAPLVSRIPAEHTVELDDGTRITSLARTAVELARRGDPLLAVVACDSALRRGATKAQLRAVVEACTGWPGVRLAREVVEFADARSESPTESMGRWRFHEFGWPASRPNAPLVVPRHPEVRVDHLFEAQRVVAEADGMVKYDEDPFALRKEKRRELAIDDAGYEVFRYTYDEVVRRPEDVRRRGEQAFDRAGRRRAS